jgi:hypothetical protein
VFFVTEGEEIVFGSREAMETELEVSAGASQFSFRLPDGCEGSDVGRGEFGIGFEFLFGEVEDLGENAVARGV